jgi:tetratricopeptide (TPR) repeat protein
VQAVAERHARWALALAEQSRGSARLDREAPNLRTAFDTLLERSPADALRLCIALLPFWMRRIDLDEAQRRFERALSALPARSRLRIDGLLAAAAIHLRSGAIGAGLATAQEAQAIASELGDTHAHWRSLQFLGEFSLAYDAADEAMPWLERALELARGERFVAEEATCIYSLGVAQWMLGDLTRGEELLVQSIDLFRALAGSPERIASPVNFAETSRPGRRVGLRVVFEDTVQPFTEISCDAAVGYVLANLTGIVRVRGDLTRARGLLDESAALFDDAGDDVGRAAVLVRRAYLELAEGALPAGRAALQGALELRRAHGDRRGVGLVLAGLGLIDTAAGDHDAAERHLADARSMFRRAGDRWGLAGTLWRTADLALARGRLDDAEAALQEARAVLGPTKRERWIANTLAGLADIARVRGDSDRARALLLDARGRYAARHDSLGVADVDDRLCELR